MIANLKEHSIKNSDKPLITITGVLGKQGHSAARTLLQSGKYRVRGITRRIDSPAALSLAEQGAELVSLPLDLGYQKHFLRISAEFDAFGI